MRVGDIVRVTEHQVLLHGFLIVERQFGMAFSIPEDFRGVPLDDVDRVEELPEEMILEELHVTDPEWWR